MLRLLTFPIAFLVGGVVLDLFGRKSESEVSVATYLGVVGVIVPSARAYLGGDIGYQGGMGIEPTILKADLLACSTANG